MSHDQVELQGTYRVAASHFLSHALLAPAWIGLQAEHPKLVGELFTLRSAQVLAGVTSGEFDFGVCFCPQSNPAVQGQMLYEGQLLIAVRSGHPLLKRKKQGSPLEKISDYPAVLPKSYPGIDNCETHPIFDRYGIRPSTSLIFDNYEVALEKIRRSDAWGLIPDWLINRAKLSSITAPDWHAPFNVAGIWPKNRILTRVMQNLLERLGREFAGEGDVSDLMPHQLPGSATTPLHL